MNDDEDWLDLPLSMTDRTISVRRSHVRYIVDKSDGSGTCEIGVGHEFWVIALSRKEVVRLVRDGS